MTGVASPAVPAESNAMDTFIVFTARYDTLSEAETDYRALRDRYLTSGRLDTFDVAVITKDEAGKVAIVAKHQKPPRQGTWCGAGVELADGALVALVGDIAAAADPNRGPQQAMAQQAITKSEAAVAAAEAEAAVAKAEAEAAAAERAAARYSTFGPSPGGDDLGTQLDDLARLRESGVLSQAEFETAKDRLLGG